ncbi:MAG TPA: NUDIX hydrolase [Microthrixaceae bacterium]|nr:NUDIX hydrolase [Microthrixaceae bacterium]
MTDGESNPNRDEFWVSEAIPAATVVVLRDGDDGVETLMLRRDGKLAFAGGMWVFPGGRIDPGDHSDTTDDAGSAESLELASRAAALRETFEETGLTLAPEDLIRWSHWTAPEQTPRRFTTAFFVAALDAGNADDEVTIDNGEIREFVWKRPAEVIIQRDEGTLGLTPPTYITLTQMLQFDDVDGLIASARTRTVEHFATRFDFIGDQMIAMYHGDAGYDSGDVHADGPRHRLLMDSVWKYVRDL